MKKEKEPSQSSEGNKLVPFMAEMQMVWGVREGGLNETSSTAHPNSPSGSGHLIFTRQGGRQAQAVGTHPSVGK